MVEHISKSFYIIFLLRYNHNLISPPGANYGFGHNFGYDEYFCLGIFSPGEKDHRLSILQISIKLKELTKLAPLWPKGG